MLGVTPQQTGKTISLWSWFCVRGYCHAETGKLEAHFCLHAGLEPLNVTR